MAEEAEDPPEAIVANCGLVCTECGAYAKGRCEGCFSDKPMFRGCPVRACTRERDHSTCAECEEFEDLRECRKLNSFVSRIFGFLFRSNRIGNLERIREAGLDTFQSERDAATDS